MNSGARIQLLKHLLGESRPLLVRRAQKMLRGPMYAEDAAQDAMVSALSHLGDFRGDSTMNTWLYRVGTNAVLMNLRHDKRMNERTKRAGEQSLTEVEWLHGTHADLPQRKAEDTEEYNLLYWAVDHLPEHYRQVVLLCDLAELSVEEVAKRLGLSIGGVRTRRLRAHRILKEILLEQHYDNK